MVKIKVVEFQQKYSNMLQVIEFGVGPAGRLKSNYSWLEPVVGRCEPGSAVSACVFIFTCFSAKLCLHIHWSTQYFEYQSWWSITLTVFLISVMLACKYS